MNLTDEQLKVRAMMLALEYGVEHALNGKWYLSALSSSADRARVPGVKRYEALAFFGTKVYDNVDKFPYAVFFGTPEGDRVYEWNENRATWEVMKK